MEPGRELVPVAATANEVTLTKVIMTNIVTIAVFLFAVGSWKTAQEKDIYALQEKAVKAEATLEAWAPVVTTMSANIANIQSTMNDFLGQGKEWPQWRTRVLQEDQQQTSEIKDNGRTIGDHENRLRRIEEEVVRLRSKNDAE